MLLPVLPHSSLNAEDSEAVVALVTLEQVVLQAKHSGSILPMQAAFATVLNDLCVAACVILGLESAAAGAGSGPGVAAGAVGHA